MRAAVAVAAAAEQAVAVAVAVVQASPFSCSTPMYHSKQTSSHRRVEAVARAAPPKEVALAVRSELESASAAPVVVVPVVVAGKVAPQA